MVVEGLKTRAQRQCRPALPVQAVLARVSAQEAEGAWAYNMRIAL